jgi:hypothetical protein
MMSLRRDNLDSRDGWGKHSASGGLETNQGYQARELATVRHGIIAAVQLGLDLRHPGNVWQTQQCFAGQKWVFGV